jgi:prepilin-type N-terminal cleavage/methylation domain-containing protein
MIRKNKSSLQEKKSEGSAKRNGFSLIEVVIGIAVIGIALLSLAQMFYYAVMNNANSDRMTNATFLAQQQIDFLRSLSGQELSNMAASPVDEKIDVNGDGVIDVRRITRLIPEGLSYRVRILVFSNERKDENINNLSDDPVKYRARAVINTIISR